MSRFLAPLFLGPSLSLSLSRLFPCLRENGSLLDTRWSNQFPSHSGCAERIGSHTAIHDALLSDTANDVCLVAQEEITPSFLTIAGSLARVSDAIVSVQRSRLCAAVPSFHEQGLARSFKTSTPRMSSGIVQVGIRICDLIGPQIEVESRVFVLVCYHYMCIWARVLLFPAPAIGQPRCALRIHEGKPGSH